MVIATFIWCFLRASDYIVPFEDVGGKGFCTNVRHGVFLNPEVILLKSLSGCSWSSFVPVVVHLSRNPSENMYSWLDTK